MAAWPYMGLLWPFVLDEPEGCYWKGCETWVELTTLKYNKVYTLLHSRIVIAAESMSLCVWIYFAIEKSLNFNIMITWNASSFKNTHLYVNWIY